MTGEGAAVTQGKAPSPLLPDAREVIAAPGCLMRERAAGTACRNLRWFAIGNRADELTAIRRRSWLASHEAAGPTIAALRRDSAVPDGRAFLSGPARPL
jgi:hypothetical protein